MTGKITTVNTSYKLDFDASLFGYLLRVFLHYVLPYARRRRNGDVGLFLADPAEPQDLLQIYMCYIGNSN